MPVEPFSLPFEEAIQFFRGKVNVPTEGWTDLWQSDHDWGFMVAGAADRDLLLDLRAAVDKAVAEGATLADFRRDFDSIVARYGWDYRGGRNWRTRTIWQTNVRGAYMAGRYRQLLEGNFPYLQYRHSHAVKEPRPEHLAWDGMILRSDDPWWKTHFPPNGWGCMCSVVGLTEADLKRMGRSGPDKAPSGGSYEWTDRRTGEIHDVPVGIDPGFAYTPGAIQGRQVEAFLKKLSEMPAALAVRAAADLLAMKTSVPALTDAYVEWATGILARPKAAMEGMAVGAISPETRQALLNFGVDPEATEIAIRNRELFHLAREAKASGLSREDLLRLPEILADPKAVLWDTQDPALLYVFDPAGSEGVGKVVVRVDFDTKTAGAKFRTNLVRSGGLVKLADLKVRRYRLLEGVL